MKKGIVLAVILGLAMASPVFAAPSARISVTVTITQSVSVFVTPGTYAFGSADAGATLSTAVNAFTADNDGNGAENLAITVGNSANWTASSSVGADAFVMNYHNGSTWALIDPTSGASLTAGLAPAATKAFGLQLLVPSATSNGGVQQSINVTVTASAQ